MFVVADHPVAQRPAAHARGFGSRIPAHAFRRTGDRQHASPQCAHRTPPAPACAVPPGFGRAVSKVPASCPPSYQRGKAIAPTRSRNSHAGNTSSGVSADGIMRCRSAGRSRADRQAWVRERRSDQGVKWRLIQFSAAQAMSTCPVFARPRSHHNQPSAKSEGKPGRNALTTLLFCAFASWHSDCFSLTRSFVGRTGAPGARIACARCRRGGTNELR